MPESSSEQSYCRGVGALYLIQIIVWRGREE